MTSCATLLTYSEAAVFHSRIFPVQGNRFSEVYATLTFKESKKSTSSRVAKTFFFFLQREIASHVISGGERCLQISRDCTRFFQNFCFRKVGRAIHKPNSMSVSMQNTKKKKTVFPYPSIRHSPENLLNQKNPGQKTHRPITKRQNHMKLTLSDSFCLFINP